MDLCHQEEELDPEETFNPTIQYFNQVVTHKMVNPEESVPESNPAITEQLMVDEELRQNAREEIEEFQNAFELTINKEDEQEQQKQRIYWRDIIEQEERKMNQGVEIEVEEQKPLTEQELERLKADGGRDDKDKDVKEIGSVNPIEDFNKMISDRKVDRVAQALRQMQKMVERYVRCSLDGDLYGKAYECIKAIREACVKEDEANSFNQFAHRVKEMFGYGPHKEFFKMMVKGNVSLITAFESEISSIVTPQ